MYVLIVDDDAMSFCTTEYLVLFYRSREQSRFFFLNDRVFDFAFRHDSRKKEVR